MNSTRLPNICFRRLLSLENVDPRYNWVLQVRQLCGQLQEPNLFDNLTSARFKYYKPELLSHYRHFLFSRDLRNVSESSFLLHPSLFTGATLSTPSGYLQWQVPIYVTRIVAQVRLCNRVSIRFTCSSGLYIIDPRVRCSVCNMQKYESLYHLLFECPIYAPTRSQFIVNLSRRGIHVGLSELDIHGAKQVAACVCNILKIRSFIFNE